MAMGSESNQVSVIEEESSYEEDSGIEMVNQGDEKLKSVNMSEISVQMKSVEMSSRGKHKGVNENVGDDILDEPSYTMYPSILGKSDMTSKGKIRGVNEADGDDMIGEISVSADPSNLGKSNL